jgi:1-pyrroline-5-carboxylate dehydrogenase
MMGALYMGNKVLIKPDSRTSFPVEQFIRLLHLCGMPKEDVTLMNSNGEVAEAVLRKTPMR